MIKKIAGWSMGGIGGAGMVALLGRFQFWQIIILTLLIGVFVLCIIFLIKNPDIIKAVSTYRRERYEEREHLAIKKKEFSGKVEARKKGKGS